MALDESKENDLTLTDQDIKFLIDKDLFEKAKPIEIEFVKNLYGSGFIIESSLPKPEGGCC